MGVLITVLLIVGVFLFCTDTDDPGVGHIVAGLAFGIIGLLFILSQFLM